LKSIDSQFIFRPTTNQSIDIFEKYKKNLEKLTLLQ